MKIIFLSLMYDISNEEYYLSRSNVGLPTALNVLQTNILSGLDSFSAGPSTVVSALPVGNFPRYYKDLIMRTAKWEHASGAEVVSIGYVNLPIIKDFQRRREAYRILDTLVANSNEKVVLFQFDIHLPFLQASSMIKKKHPGVKVVNMITDLPNEYGFDDGRKGIKRLILNCRGKQQIGLISSLDAYVLLTEKMKDVIGIVDKPYLVVEGMIDGNVIHANERLVETRECTKAIMYAGYLQQEYGIMNLIKAFQNIKSIEIELWIFGDGDAKRNVMDACSKDRRIIYFGYRTKSEVEEYQKNAAVLVNPRMNIGTYTSYSFPSKTLEYLKSLKPTIGYLLDGMPREYGEILLVPRDNTVESLSQKLLEALTFTQQELIEYRHKVSDFLSRKTIAVQCDLIYHFLERL